MSMVSKGYTGAFPFYRYFTTLPKTIVNCTHFPYNTVNEVIVVVKQKRTGFDKINFELLKELSALQKKKKLIVEVDQTTKSTEGIKIERAKPGYNTKRKGRCFLKYSISTVSG